MLSSYVHLLPTLPPLLVEEEGLRSSAETSGSLRRGGAPSVSKAPVSSSTSTLQAHRSMHHTSAHMDAPTTPIRENCRSALLSRSPDMVLLMKERRRPLPNKHIEAFSILGGRGYLFCCRVFHERRELVSFIAIISKCLLPCCRVLASNHTTL